jgi:hypothetical protein
LFSSSGGVDDTARPTKTTEYAFKTGGWASYKRGNYEVREEERMEEDNR